MTDKTKKDYAPDLAEHIELGIAIVLQLAIFLLLLGALYEKQWLVAFTAAVVLTLTFVPAAIEHRLGVHLPVEFTLITCVFLYAAFGLGEIRDFYYKYWWWDLMLHSFSALIMGLIGFLIIYVFHMTQRVRIAPIYLAAITFGFAVTVGTLWEIFEFLVDWFGGFNMQKSGLVDTMTDLLVNFAGGLIAAFIGYTYVKGGDSLVAGRVIRKFVKRNPQLFRKKRIASPPGDEG